jgi:nucleotide-binding universal stress UspA family protein
MIGTALVPHDLTDDADAAFEALHGLGVPARQIHVVHVLPRIDPGMPGLVWPRDEDEGRLEHARRAITDRLRGTDLEGAVIHICIGDPASRIVTLASEIGADLIVVPSHGRRGWKRLLLGSVTAHVSRFARCPVLVVPAGASPWRAGPPPHEAPSEAGPFDRIEEVDALGVRISRLVDETPGWLAALCVAIPEDEDVSWWEEALQRRMAAAGIEFVDLAFAPRHTRHAEILDARFEEKFAD